MKLTKNYLKKLIEECQVELKLRKMIQEQLDNELEESEASDEAHKKGLKNAGFGRWKDRTGKVVAKTDKGKLVMKKAAAQARPSKKIDATEFRAPKIDLKKFSYADKEPDAIEPVQSKNISLKERSDAKLNLSDLDIGFDDEKDEKEHKKVLKSMIGKNQTYIFSDQDDDDEVKILNDIVSNMKPIETKNHGGILLKKYIIPDKKLQVISSEAGVYVKGQATQYGTERDIYGTTQTYYVNPIK